MRAGCLLSVFAIIGVISITRVIKHSGLNEYTQDVEFGYLTNFMHVDFDNPSTLFNPIF